METESTLIKLARILQLFSDDYPRAIAYCVRQSILFPQFDEEFTMYAKMLVGAI